MSKRCRLALKLFPIFLFFISSSYSQSPIIVTLEPQIITLKPQISYSECELRLRGTDGIYVNHYFQAGNIPFIEPLDGQGKPLPDGLYRYELRLLPQKKTKAKVVRFAGRFIVNDGKMARMNAEHSQDHYLEDAGIYPWPGGQLGLGVATPDPSSQLHLQSTGEPRMRLEHLGEQRQAGYSWDLLANEDGFHLENHSDGGQTEPFFIASGAPDGAFYLKEDGKVGIGTSKPKATLQVESRDQGDVLYIRNRSNKSKRRNVLTLENRGEVAFQMVKNPSGDIWSFIVRDKDFLISRNGSRAEEFRITENGTLFTHGSINPKSDAAAKTNFQSVDGSQILAGIASLPIQSWTYINDGDEIRHVGPTSQAFRQAFDFGADDGSISVVDSNGVALIAIQELESRLQKKDAEIKNLESQNQALAARLARLEAKMTELLTVPEEVED